MIQKFKDIRGILFDLDGTLTDYNASSQNGLKQAYLCMNPSDKRKIPFYLFKKTYESVIEDEASLTSQNGIPLPAHENRMNRFHKIFLKLQVLQKSDLSVMAQRYSYGRSHGAKLNRGVNSVLLYLRKHYRLGLITEGNVATQMEQLTLLNLTRFFDKILISGQTPYHKPDIRLYQMAVDGLGFKAEEILMVGDRIDWDLKPAKILGMKTVYFSEDFTAENMIQYLDVVDFTVKSMTELKGLRSK